MLSLIAVWIISLFPGAPENIGLWALEQPKNRICAGKETGQTADECNGGASRGKLFSAGCAYEDNKIRLFNQFVELGMDERRAGWINHFQYLPGDIENLMPDLYFQINSTYEYHNTVKIKDISIIKTSDKIVCKIQQSWPNADLVKTVELFEGKAYIHLRYDVEVLADFKTVSFLLRLITCSQMNSVYWGATGGCVYKRHSMLGTSKWFSIPRSEQDRWMIFQDSKTGEGFAVIGGDSKKWAEHPSSFLSCEVASGGYSIQFPKRSNMEMRKGDKVSFDFFLYAFKDNNDASIGAKRILNELTGGFL